MPRKITQKGWIRKLDKLCSEIVLAPKGTCPFCNLRTVNNAFHFVSRRHYALRWDLVTPNVVASCWPCNSKYSGVWGGGNQAPFWRWYVDKFGRQAWDRLIAKSRQTTHLSETDLETIYKELQFLKH